MVALEATPILFFIVSVPGIITHCRTGQSYLARRIDVAAELNRCDYIGSLLTSSKDQ